MGSDKFNLSVLFFSVVLESKSGFFSFSPYSFLLVTLCFSPRNSMTFGCYLYELVFLRDDV